MFLTSRKRMLKAVAKSSCYGVLDALARILRLTHSERPPGSFSSILLSEISLLGDVVSVTPSLRAARGFWPKARIHVVVQRQFVPLVLHSPHIDGVLPLPNLTLSAFAKALRAVRRQPYDLALSLSPGVRNACLTLLSGADAVAGYLIDRDFPPHFLNKHRIEGVGICLVDMPEVGRETHIADRGLKVLAALGARVPVEGRPELAVDVDAQAVVEARLAAQGILGRGPFAVLHPSAREAERRWPAERFVAVARHLSDDLGLRTVWVGGLRDKRLVMNLQAMLQRGSVAMVGRPLDEVMVTLRKAALFVCDESGPMHMAGALGTPLVAIFGPNDPPRLLPRNANAVAVGGWVGGADEPMATCDVSEVGVNDVMDAVRNVVGEDIDG